MLKSSGQGQNVQKAIILQK